MFFDIFIAKKKTVIQSAASAASAKGGCASSRLDHGLQFYVIREGCASSRLINELSDCVHGPKRQTSIDFLKFRGYFLAAVLNFPFFFSQALGPGPGGPAIFGRSFEFSIFFSQALGPGPGGPIPGQGSGPAKKDET